jgi:phosphoribosyl 1,2-cyclic phosphodiesterase
MGVGGNTSCIEVRLPGGEILIVDAGTGASQLGSALSAEGGGKTSNLHLFLTHFHWDHIQGLPFFKPLYSKENNITFYSMKSPDETRIILEGQMDTPYFPVDFRFLPAQRSFVDGRGETFRFGDFEVKSFPLNHPQGCHGYCFTGRGRKVVVASDLEPGNQELDALLIEVARNADLLIYDSQFLPEELERHHGWGHSTWFHGTETAKATGARKLILFHHDPARSDKELDEILRHAREAFQETHLAIEGESHWV